MMQTNWKMMFDYPVGLVTRYGMVTPSGRGIPIFWCEVLKVVLYVNPLPSCNGFT